MKNRVYLILLALADSDLHGLGIARALAATGFLANWLPARRASRVHPMISLRAD